MCAHYDSAHVSLVVGRIEKRCKVYHCFFEQSGTFKDAFIKLGYAAKDYDIENQFGKTDYVIDLFAEIEKAYNDAVSVFDEIDQEDDTVLAFFPCIRFSQGVSLMMLGKKNGMQKWDEVKKLEYDIELQKEQSFLYEKLCKLCIVCMKKNIKLIIENPYTQPSYLTLYFPLIPAVIDKDRRLNGDRFKKPTMYYFINCEPKNNLVFEALTYKESKKVDIERGIQRSIIESEYAKRFIKTFII